MARMVKLSAEETGEALAQAAERTLQLRVTVRRQNRWLSFRSHFIVMHEGHFWIEFPTADTGEAAFDYADDEELGLMFHLGPARCLFSGIAIAQESYTGESGQDKRALRMKPAGVMQRSQRRLHQREDAHADWQARVSFWLGGREVEPDQAHVDAPVWSGRLIDLSTGGLLVRVSIGAARYIEPGDIVGICLAFGADGRNVYLDAQLRHSDPDGEMALMGFQFVDVETDYAREALAVIADKLREQG